MFHGPTDLPRYSRAAVTFMHNAGSMQHRPALSRTPIALDILELHPCRDLVEDVARSFGLVTSDAVAYSPYFIEAVRHSLETLRLGIETKRTPFVGIHSDHPLRPLRDLVRMNVEDVRAATRGQALLLWGAPARSGRVLYASLGALLRETWIELHVQSHPEMYGERDTAALAMCWLEASGVTDPRVVSAAWRLVEDHFLTRRPIDRFARLSSAVMKFAVDAVPNDPKLAVLFFRCLQRVEARRFRDLIRWRSAWLRGRRAGGPDAIAGASTCSAQLTALLNQHVFTKVAGHSAGTSRSKAATYRIRMPLSRGNKDIADMAAAVGVELGAGGRPLRIIGRQ